MEFHLPYFALRSSPSPGDPAENVKIRSARQWTDLSFLNIPLPKSQGQGRHGIYEAQISFVICGSDHSRWAAYAFDDTYYDSNNLGDEDFAHGGLCEDLIASDGELDASFPIGDPREYFLTIFEIRIDRVRREWMLLVRSVERSIKEYVCRCVSLPELLLTEDIVSPLTGRSEGMSLFCSITTT